MNDNLIPTATQQIMRYEGGTYRHGGWVALAGTHY